MGFENFGTVSFTAESKTADFITYLEQGKVMTTRCKKCGTAYFPPKMDCPGCLDSEVEWFEIKNPGKLVTYTVVSYGPSGFEEEAPYTLGIGEFDGLRVFGRLSKSIKEGEVKTGMAIKVVPVKLPGEKIAYEFIKA
jgi:uncharacterized OB-fold protein